MRYLMKLVLALSIVALATPAHAEYEALLPALVWRVETVAKVNVAVPTGTTTIGNVTVNSANRCALLTAQTDSRENGIYCYDPSTWKMRYMVDAGWLAVLVLHGTDGGSVCQSMDFLQVGIASTWICTSIRPHYVSTIMTGDGTEQSIAHGFGFVPTKVRAAIVGLPAGTSFVSAQELIFGTHDATNLKITAPSGVKYQIDAE